MDVNIRRDERGVYIIECPPEMEWTVRVDLVSMLTERIGDEEFRGVILDLGEVNYINSAGLGAVFALRKHAMDNDASIVIARPKPGIQRMLKTVNLPTLIPVVDSLAQARDKIGQ
jgi:anti-sigma B factor antagonist